MTAVSQEIKRVRAQMEENEQLASLMKGLRGQNLNDSQFAADDVELRLVEVCLSFRYDDSLLSFFLFINFPFYTPSDLKLVSRYSFLDGLKQVYYFSYWKIIEGTFYTPSHMVQVSHNH